MLRSYGIHLTLYCKDIAIKVLSVLFNDFPSSMVRGIGRGHYAKKLGVDWVDLTYIPTEVIDRPFLIPKLNKNVVKSAEKRLAKKFDEFSKIIKNDVDVIYLINRPNPDLFEFLVTFEKPIVYDFDDPLYLSEFDTKATFKSDLYKYQGLTVDNKFALNEVKKYNEHVIFVDGITPVARTQKALTKECVLIWIGSESTAMYVKPHIAILEKLLNKHENFKIILLGVNSSHIDINSNKVKYVHTYNADDIVSYCQESDIGFYPVFDNTLGLHRGVHKLNIYFNCLIPVIAFDNTITAKTINNNNGFLFSNNNEFENSLNSFISNIDLREKMKLYVDRKYGGHEQNIKSTNYLINFFQNIILNYNSKKLI